MTVVCYCSCAASVSRQLGFTSLLWLYECNPVRWRLYVIIHASVGRQFGFGLLCECIPDRWRLYVIIHASVSRQFGFGLLCECSPVRWRLYVIIHASVGRQLGFGLLSECFVTVENLQIIEFLAFQLRTLHPWVDPALEQTHHAPVACDFEWVTPSFFLLFWL